ncbi:MAG: hypothetical protein H6766_02350 [Candidatus Peribacteria bacterium]|nr:MAG: hypothetical protein H6766_02350 [Candidatus Peribacteria bacterium]
MDGKRIVRRKSAEMIQYAAEEERGELSKHIKYLGMQKDYFNHDNHNLYQYDDIKGKISKKSAHGATISIEKQRLQGKVYHRIMDINS